MKVGIFLRLYLPSKGEKKMFVSIFHYMSVISYKDPYPFVFYQPDPDRSFSISRPDPDPSNIYPDPKYCIYGRYTSILDLGMFDHKLIFLLSHNKIQRILNHHYFARTIKENDFLIIRFLNLKWDVLEDDNWMLGGIFFQQGLKKSKNFTYNGICYYNLV